MEQRFIRKDGELLYGYLTVSMICDKGGKPSYFLLMIEDITACKNLERQLRHAQKMKAIGTLTGGIAHEFNNILQIITCYNQIMLMESAVNGPTRKMIGEIDLAVDRAANLIRGMLTFSQQQLTNPQPVLLNETIRAIRTHLAEITGGKVTVETELSEEGLTVMADRGQIEQILINLTENARDAMPSGGALTIKTSPIRTGEACRKASDCAGADLYALISVSDSGEGMDGKTVARIFEPFFTTREVGKGTGLGLSVVYGIVRQYGGYIDVQSEPGKGTTFNIYLPLSADLNVRC